jgi:hypothetical protein
MKKIVTILLMLVLFPLAACTPYHAQGVGVGGAIGGITGAILDHRNPWRGGLIGAGIGAIAGATIADISLRGSQEAIRHGRPVEYTTEDGRGRYYAEPESDYYYDGPTRCRKIREKVWEDGRLVRDSVREVCEGTREERRY